MMDLIKARHSVRNFTEKAIEGDVLTALQDEVKMCNSEGGLHIQLFVDEPEAFQANKPHYGQFSGCRNYFALVGPNNADEKIGYYGERLVLKAQELGLNTCWVALTYKKGKVTVEVSSGEKLYIVIALGYGENQGNARKSKDISALSNLKEDSPEWFRNGMEAAALAPTAMNQQRFYIENDNGIVSAKARLGFYTRIDLGIVKYHFELGAGKDSFTWK